MPDPIVVRVTKADGSDFDGKVVTFEVSRNNGSRSRDGVTPEGLRLQCPVENGLAQAFWTLGTDVGCGTNRIRVTSRDIAGNVTFCASGTPDAAFQVEVGTGSGLQGEADGPAPEPLRAFVHDGWNGVPGANVLFTVIEGGGRVNGESFAVVQSGETGHAEVEFYLGQEPGLQVVEARLANPNFAGGTQAPAVFYLYGLARTEDSTQLTGLVVDNAEQPLQGAEVHVFVGGTEIATTTSDIQGVGAD